MQHHAVNFGLHFLRHTIERVCLPPTFSTRTVRRSSVGLEPSFLNQSSKQAARFLRKRSVEIIEAPVGPPKSETPWALMLNLRWIGSAGPPLFATASSSPASWDFCLPSKMSSCERLRQCLCTLHATMERLGCGCKALKASNPSRTGFVQKLQMFVLFLLHRKD